MGHTDLNSHIFAYEDGMWAVKGRFSEVLHDNDPVQWVATSDGKFSLSLLAEGTNIESGGNFGAMASSLSMADPVVASASGSTKAPFSTPEIASGKGFFQPGSIRDLIVTTLGLSKGLIDRSKPGDIRMAYARYVALVDTLKTLGKMSITGAWTQKYNNDDVIEIFMSKSSYFTNHSPVFSKLNKFPAMEKWLQNGDDAPTDAEVWGYQKQTFENLRKILKSISDPDSGPAPVEKRGKGKGKEKAEDSSSSIIEEPVKKAVQKKTATSKKNKSGGKKKASSSKGRNSDK
jgi:hypothetical protein